MVRQSDIGNVYLQQLFNKEKQALRRFLWAAQLKFDLDADKLLDELQNVCQLCAISMQTLYNQCANFVQKHCLLHF